MLIQINIQKKKLGEVNIQIKYMYMVLFCYVDKANQQIKLLGKLFKKQSVNTDNRSIYFCHVQLHSVIRSPTCCPFFKKLIFTLS